MVISHFMPLLTMLVGNFSSHARIFEFSHSLDRFHNAHAHVFLCLSLRTGNTKTALPAYGCYRRCGAINVSRHIFTFSLMMHTPDIPAISGITVDE